MKGLWKLKLYKEIEERMNKRDTKVAEKSVNSHFFSSAPNPIVVYIVFEAWNSIQEVEILGGKICVT